MLRPGDVIVLCVVCLLCIGAVMVNSAGLSVGGDGDPVTLWSIVVSRSSAYAAAAVLAMALAARAPTERLLCYEGRRTALIFPCLALASLCLLVYVPYVGLQINGAHRWIGLPIPGGEFSFQPSEVAKWGLILALGWRYAGRVDELRRFGSGLLPALIAVGVVVAIITAEDLGTGIVIAATSTLILLAAGARLTHFLLMTPLVGLAMGAAVIAKPYRVERLVTFLHPFNDPDGAGYHMIQSMVAVANGRVFGRGLGFGLQKFGYLPADRSDFLFAVICEELGLVGAAVVIVLYLGVIWAGWKIVRNEPRTALRLVGLGIISTVGLQAVMNLAVVTGLGPTKGIALPLLSAGGTGWILTAASLGLLVGLDRRHAAAAAAAPTPTDAAPAYAQ